MDDGHRSSSATPALSAAAIAALRRGNKIEAIKLVRVERNLGLKEAKDVVEDYLSGQPDLQSALTDAQGEAKRGAVVWVAVLLGLAILAYYFLAKR